MAALEVGLNLLILALQVLNADQELLILQLHFLGFVLTSLALLQYPLAQLLVLLFERFCVTQSGGGGRLLHYAQPRSRLRLNLALAGFQEILGKILLRVEQVPSLSAKEILQFRYHFCRRSGIRFLNYRFYLVIFSEQLVIVAVSYLNVFG